MPHNTINNSKVITRFAPSPTGLFHIGAVRTVLFNFAYAKKHGGEMILRIEDTDKERSKKEYETDLEEGLKWLGLSYSKKYRQSERTDIYKEHIEKLLDGGFAYESREEKDGEERSVIRFRNPKKQVKFQDIIRGEIEFDTTELGDFVIARTSGHPLYHLAVVIDDNLMDVTHVIRGEDHISNTPRQILLQEALGMHTPAYAHLPLVLAPDKSKLSKRNLRGGMIAVREYRDAGYIPDAILNFTSLLGWSPEEEGKEIFSLNEFVKLFTLERIQKGSAQFNIEKLRWVNKEHIKRLTNEEVQKGILENLPQKIKELSQYTEERLERSMGAISERIEVFGDLSRLGEEGELDYFFEAPAYENPLKIASPKKDVGAEETKRHIDKIIELLSNIQPSDFFEEKIKDAVWSYASDVGRANVLWPMRYALSGKDKSVDPFTLAYILGKEETIRRLENAIATLK